MAGDEIWMTTAIESPISDEEKAERLKGNTGNQPLNVAGKLSLRALCVDRRSGKLIHNVELLVEPKPQPAHAMNSFASPTPVLEDGKLYCHFGAYGTACLDTATQKVLWTNRDTVINHENGPGSSPVLEGDLLIFHCDGSDQQYIAALDKRTGKLAWKTDRSGEMNAEPQLKKSYGTPLVVEIDGKANLVSPAADWLYGYDPATGRELWKVPYEKLGFSISPRPVAGHGMVFMSTSFMQAELIAFKYDQPGKPEIAWRFGRQAPSIPSPLLVGDEIYIVSDKGIATCLDAHTGNRPLDRATPRQLRRLAALCRRQDLFRQSRGTHHRNRPRHQLPTARHRPAPRPNPRLPHRRRPGAVYPHGSGAVPD